MRRLLPLAAALLFSATTAHAQIVSLYGTFTEPHISNVVNGGTTSSTSTTSFWTPGAGGGITFGILPIGPVHIGFDLRGSAKTGNNSADTVFAGLRIGLKLPIIRIKPYIQASGGYLRTSVTLVNSPLPAGTQGRQAYAAYEILGGVDYPLIRILDFRIIEIGGGQGFPAFGSSGATNVSLLTLSTGLVLHF